MSVTKQYDYAKYKTPTGTTLHCKGWVQGGGFEDVAE